MKRVMSVVLAVALVAVAGVVFAQGPGGGPMMGGRGWGMGPGPGMMGPGGAGAGWACPGWAGGAAAAPTEAITEEKAKELATEYVNKYFKGFTVERVLPFTGRLHTMYQVELKGPKGETRYLHVNPWGAVRPYGPFAAVE